MDHQRSAHQLTTLLGRLVAARALSPPETPAAARARLGPGSIEVAERVAAARRRGERAALRSETSLKAVEQVMQFRNRRGRGWRLDRLVEPAGFQNETMLRCPCGRGIHLPFSQSSVADGVRHEVLLGVCRGCGAQVAVALEDPFTAPGHPACTCDDFSAGARSPAEEETSVCETCGGCRHYAGRMDASGGRWCHVCGECTNPIPPDSGQ